MMRDFPITTDEYWTVDGYPLNQYAHNIESWGGTRQGVPSLEGDDLEYGDWAGERWMRKSPGSRIITIRGWVTGELAAGSVLDGVDPMSPRQAFRQNWYMLRRLLWNPYRQVKLSKRFRRPSDLALIEVSAMVEFSDGLEPRTFSESGATWEVDLKLADPFFYSELKTTPAFTGQTLETPATPLPAASQIYIEGDYSPKGVQINFSTGGSWKPIFKVINTPSAGGVASSVEIANVAMGANYTLDVDTGRITPAGPRVSAWSGRKMLELNPGVNSIQFAGSGSIGYKEAWL